MKKILVVSPHLDDGILSCGPYISKCIRSGDNVTILTVFSGSIDAAILPPLAKWFHSICGLEDDAMEIRRFEDQKACTVVNANYIHLNLHECLYRLDEEGHPRYTIEESIFCSDASNEQDIIDLICLMLSEHGNLNEFDEILIPLGIGRHVDHLIVRKALENLVTADNLDQKKILYYEDTPYVCTNKDKHWKNDLAYNLKAYNYNINSKEFIMYLRALNCYKSQVFMLWAGKKEMLTQLKEYYLRGRTTALIGTFWKY